MRLPASAHLVALAKRSDAGSDKLSIDVQIYAGALLNARIARYRDFDAVARKEACACSPVLRFKVASAWRLAQPL